MRNSCLPSSLSIDGSYPSWVNKGRSTGKRNEMGKHAIVCTCRYRRKYSHTHPQLNLVSLKVIYIMGTKSKICPCMFCTNRTHTSTMHTKVIEGKCVCSGIIINQKGATANTNTHKHTTGWVSECASVFREKQHCRINNPWHVTISAILCILCACFLFSVRWTYYVSTFSNITGLTLADFLSLSLSLSHAWVLAQFARHFLFRLPPFHFLYHTRTHKAPSIFLKSKILYCQHAHLLARVCLCACLTCGTSSCIRSFIHKNGNANVYHQVKQT